MTHQTEQWKEIEGYDGDYLISNHGNVLSLKGKVPLKMKLSAWKKNYRYVMLHKNAKSKFRPVHRLVALAFIPNPENKPQINHIDFNPSNNHVSNLEWCTGYENYMHSVKHGRVRPPIIQKPLKMRKGRGKKFYVYTKYGIFIKECIRIKTEATFHNIGIGTMSDRIKDEKPIGNYRYSFHKKDKLESINAPYKLPFDFTIKRHKGIQPVFAYDMSGNIKAYYQSVTDAANRLSLRAKSISNVISGYKKSTGNYVFKKAPIL